MSNLTLMMILINAVVIIIGIIVGGTAWFVTLVCSLITILLLYTKTFLCVVPSAIGIVAGGLGMFSVACILIIINAVIFFYTTAHDDNS